jgi:hypothetical protein
VNARPGSVVAAVAAIATSVTLLAGCSPSSAPSAKGTGAGTGVTSAAGTAGSGVDAATLAARLNTALTGLTSAHMQIDAGSLGGTSTADLTLADGHATATDVHLTTSGQQVEVITVGSDSYVKTASDAAKPWIAVTPDSSNPIVKSLASGFSVATLTSSLSALSGMLKSSSGLQDKGTEQIDGVSTTHYAMQLDPAKGTGDAQLDGLLALLGKTALPIDLWLDGQHRPVQLVIHVSLAGTADPVTVQISKFDAPVTITAPPADQISGK